jgi:hypothetical protein
MLLGLGELMKTELYLDRASVSTFIMGRATRLRCQLSRHTESPHQQPNPQPAAAAAMADTATPTTATTVAPGLVVAATDPIRSFLSSASASEYHAADIRGLASALSSESAVPYRSLRAIWCAVSLDARPPLRDLLQGTEFVLPSPKPREKVLRHFALRGCDPAEAWVLIPTFGWVWLLLLLQSAELKARLEKLREMQERREYAELVKDVVPPSKDDSPEPFSSYKDQIGFG